MPTSLGILPDLHQMNGRDDLRERLDAGLQLMQETTRT